MIWERVIDEIDFGEGPRWHDGRFWFSDFYQHTISSVGDDGVRRIEHADVGRPSGLGWLPDGRLLFVEMLSRTVRRIELTGKVLVHADLSDIATGYCNDMVVDAAGNAYVGNFGFDLEGGTEMKSASLALIYADGSPSVAATDLLFPNGSVITESGTTLVVGETWPAEKPRRAASGTRAPMPLWEAIAGAGAGKGALWSARGMLCTANPFKGSGHGAS